MLNSSPIVVLDSGLGGLTVVRAIRRVLPAEDVVYFGDTARLPYGNKSSATVTGFVREIIDYLLPLRPKHVVIGCNTATALALPAIRAAFPDLTVSGVIDPGAKAAAIAAGAKKRPVIGVLATEATVKSKAYERAILRRRSRARLLLRPAPLLVPMIEDGRQPHDPLVRMALKQYLQPLAQHPVDVLVLGCTHYPILKGAIVAVMGEGVAVIDSADQCADDVARRLRAAGLLKGSRWAIGPVTRVAPTAEHPVQGSPSAPIAAQGPMQGWGAGLTSPGSLRCFVTDDAPRFAALAQRYLGETIDPPTWVSADELRRPDSAAVAAPALGLRVPA